MIYSSLNSPLLTCHPNVPFALKPVAMALGHVFETILLAILQFIKNRFSSVPPPHGGCCTAVRPHECRTARHGVRPVRRRHRRRFEGRAPSTVVVFASKNEKPPQDKAYYILLVVGSGTSPPIQVGAQAESGPTTAWLGRGSGESGWRLKGCGWRLYN